MYKPNPKVTGYHGTYVAYIESIQKNNFRESTDHRMWYGDGTYFFVEGLGNPPVDSALQYITDERAKSPSPDSPICVLEATIKVIYDKILDMTQDAGIEIFNEFRERVYEEFAKNEKEATNKVQDFHVYQKIREKLGIEFVKGHVYIKFASRRTFSHGTSVPNVTIFVVSNPAKNVQKPSIKRVK